MILLTSNPHKADEFRAIFLRYGIRLKVMDPSSGTTPAIQDLFAADPKLKAVLVETSYLDVAEPKHLDLVTNTSRMTAHLRTNDGFEERSYVAEVSGYIDETLRQPDRSRIFGWDDIFVANSTHLSYQQMKQRGLKVSARDLVIGQFLDEQIRYDQRIDLNFNPQGQVHTIEFGSKLYEFIRTNPYLNNTVMESHPMRGLLTAVVQSGVFFRSADNRRQKNYWLPGLNAGIPLTPKKDEIHEITFMVHDFMHFLIPDLVYTGNDSQSPLKRKIYILHRMMSEAITLVLADMLFVDTLVRSGFEYDWSKRRIYPLFQAYAGHFPEARHDLAALKDLVWANIQFALLGNGEPLRGLTSDADFEAYRTKYERFFIEDYRWTAANYENMTRRSDMISSWASDYGHLIQDCGLTTIEQMASRIMDQGHSTETITGNLFRIVWDDLVAASSASSLDIDQARTNGFRRYMLGQLSLFSRFSHVPGAQVVGKRIAAAIHDRSASNLSLNEIVRIRKFFNAFVDWMARASIISHHEADMYMEIHPMFDPFYVFYDSGEAGYSCVAEARHHILERMC